MAAILVYVTDSAGFTNSLDSLLNWTPPGQQLVICDDSGRTTIPEDQHYRILRTDHVGRARAWTAAVACTDDPILVCLQFPVKFQGEWLNEFTPEAQQILCPQIAELDNALWSTRPLFWHSYGWRWDLQLINRPAYGEQRTPALPPFFSFQRAYYEELGGFDQEMDYGEGDTIELALRAWLAGGTVLVAATTVAAPLQVLPSSIRNRARIAERYFDNYLGLFYEATGLDPTTVTTGKLTEPTVKRTFEWFLQHLLPDLAGLYKLRNSATGKSVAVVTDGPSIDQIPTAWISRHDLIICTDYMGRYFDADYVVTFNPEVLREQTATRRRAQLLSPYFLLSTGGGLICRTTEIAPQAITFELAAERVVQLQPPLANFGHPVHCALHLALLLGAGRVTLYGCDSGLVGGRSHTAKIEAYQGGFHWSDNEFTTQKFNLYEEGLSQLSQLFQQQQLPLLRVNHV